MILYGPMQRLLVAVFLGAAGSAIVLAGVLPTWVGWFAFIVGVLQLAFILTIFSMADPTRFYSVTVNMGEDGILELCELLIERGIGIEAGLLSLRDAHIFVQSGIAPRCKRVLVEPLDADPDDAVALAEAIEQVLADGGVRLEQVHHGDGIASWAVNRRAIARGHSIRTGLEDTPVLPDGRIASGNGELVAAAVLLLKQARGRAIS
ncbi:3-keto-5-aminohexanoate cleavage protein [Calidithermus roseus]|nr:3-keto-5-aminohexanoate cleavage protein [Calidithermus roseus]